MISRGRFITFEGGEGAGKSTEVRRLAAALGRARIDVVTTREPGGTPGAEAIRGLLVEGAAERWLPTTELLLHTAARHDHVVRTIAPALEAGRWVISDRFADSTRVYQGVAGAVGRDLVDRLHAAILGGFEPDLTLILDVPVDVGLARRGRTTEDRYERMGADFHSRVREGFLELGRGLPGRCVVIDAARPVDVVARTVRTAVAARLGVAFAGRGGRSRWP